MAEIVSSAAVDEDVRPDQLYKAMLRKAHPFRMAIETYGLFSKNGNLIITADNVICTDATPDRSFSMTVVIWHYEMSPYLPFYDGRGAPQYVFGFETKNLQDQLHGIQKNDGLEMQLLHGSPYMYFRIIRGSRATGNNYNQLMNCRVDKIYVEPETYSRPDTRPNCVVNSEEFFDMIKALLNINPSAVTITAYPRGIRFEAERPGGFSKVTQVCGSIPRGRSNMSPLDSQYQIVKVNAQMNGLTLSDATAPSAPVPGADAAAPSVAMQDMLAGATPENYEVRMVVTGQTFALLTKISGMAPKDTSIRLLAEANKPLKIILHLGNYGWAIYHLRGRFT